MLRVFAKLPDVNLITRLCLKLDKIKPEVEALLKNWPPKNKIDVAINRNIRTAQRSNRLTDHRFKHLNHLLY